MNDIYNLIKCWLGLHDWHIRHETDYEYKNGWLIGFTKYVKKECLCCGKIKRENEEKYCTFINFGKKFDPNITPAEINSRTGVFTWRNWFWRRELAERGSMLNKNDEMWFPTYMLEILKDEAAYIEDELS
jgi:hypothetical protein